MRVLTIGDSPTLNTGFGRVNRIATDKLVSEGHEVASLAGLLSQPPTDDKGYRLYIPTTKGDQLGIYDIQDVVEDFKPDALYMTGDPGSVTAIAYGAPDMPAFAYMPIEGEPIVNKHWRVVLSSLPMLTCSAYGVKVVKESLGRDVDFAYHGVDHDTFEVTGIREDVRKQMKWEDKFVIICVSTNVRRKQLPRLMEAVAKLKHVYHQKDVVLYMHTVVFQDYWLEGWNLHEISQMYDIEDIVMFHPMMDGFNKSIPERTDNPQFPGLVDLYNAADLFVLPSQVEGFGLPIAEAMACGVPVMVTKYAAGWEVASPAGKGLTVSDWEVHKSGSVYANVSIDAMAKDILKLKRSPRELERMSQRGLERVRDFVWSDFEGRLTPALERAIERHQERHTEEEEADPAEAAEKQEEVSGRESQPSEAVQAEGSIPQGQG